MVSRPARATPVDCPGRGLAVRGLLTRECARWMWRCGRARTTSSCSSRASAGPWPSTRPCPRPTQTPRAQSNLTVSARAVGQKRHPPLTTAAASVAVTRRARPPRSCTGRCCAARKARRTSSLACLPGSPGGTATPPTCPESRTRFLASKRTRQRTRGGRVPHKLGRRRRLRPPCAPRSSRWRWTRGAGLMARPPSWPQWRGAWRPTCARSSPQAHQRLPPPLTAGRQSRWPSSAGTMRACTRSSLAGPLPTASAGATAQGSRSSTSPARAPTPCWPSPWSSVAQTTVPTHASTGAPRWTWRWSMARLTWWPPCSNAARSPRGARTRRATRSSTSPCCAAIRPLPRPRPSRLVGAPLSLHRTPPRPPARRRPSPSPLSSSPTTSSSTTRTGRAPRRSTSRRAWACHAWPTSSSAAVPLWT
mmetsp:Transcript_12256/g.36574  ORF Transcript_12256/g.36574 Transcript_12256/m.36574 type:complete len:420 (-) Transcript_12256:545-1804(-)